MEAAHMRVSRRAMGLQRYEASPGQQRGEEVREAVKAPSFSSRLRAERLRLAGAIEKLHQPQLQALLCDGPPFSTWAIALRRDLLALHASDKLKDIAHPDDDHAGWKALMVDPQWKCLCKTMHSWTSTWPPRSKPETLTEVEFAELEQTVVDQQITLSLPLLPWPTFSTSIFG